MSTLSIAYFFITDFFHSIFEFKYFTQYLFVIDVFVVTVLHCLLCNKLILRFIKSCCLCTVECSKSHISFCFICCSLKKPVYTAGTSLDFGTEPSFPLYFETSPLLHHILSPCLSFSLSAFIDYHL